MVAVPDPPRGVRNQVSQGPGDAVFVPGAVLREGFQGLPGGGLLQGQDRLGDGVFLDVQRHGVIHSAKRWKPWRLKAQAKALSKACQMDQVSLASVMMRLLCRGQLGLGPPGRFRPGDASFNTVRPLSYSGVFRGNYCLLATSRMPPVSMRPMRRVSVTRRLSILIFP